MAANLTTNKRASAIQKAAQLFRARQYARAESHCLKFLRVFPKSHELYEVLGLSFAQQNKMEPALAAFTAVHKLGKANDTIYSNMAKANYELGRYATSEKILLQLRTRSPNDLGVALMLGDLSIKQGRLVEALDYYATAVVNPKFACDARRGRASIFKTMMDLDKSLEEARLAIAAASDGAFGPSHLLTYPIGVLSREDIDTAEAMLKKDSSRRTPPSKKIHLEGLIAAHRGDLKTAAKKYLAANQLKLMETREAASVRQSFEDATQAAELCRHRVVDGLPDAPSLLLIVGPSTSGKSTLESILVTSQKAIPRYEAFNREALKSHDNPDLEQDPSSLLESLFFLGPAEQPIANKTIVDTLPSIVFHLPWLIERLPKLYVIFVEKDRLPLTVDILAKYYTNGNLYSYNLAATREYIDEYSAYMDRIAGILGDRFLTVHQTDIAADPQGVIGRIEKMLGQDLGIDAEAVRPKIYPQPEGYYETMAELLGIPRD